MWKNVSIIRNENSLLQALSDLKKISEEFGKNRYCASAEEFELRNLLHVAHVITNMALTRKESIGAHFRDDSPVAEEKISVEVKNNESISVK